jgi:hypothetical protein
MMTSRDGKLILPNCKGHVEGTGYYEWVDRDTIRLVNATFRYNVSEMETQVETLNKLIN